MGMDAIGGLVMVAIFAFLLLGLVALAKGARTVKQYEKGLITRLGKYHGMAPSGLTFIVPFVDDIMRVDMREQVITVPPQKLITKDNVTVEVDAVVYYKVIDPVKSQYEVQDFGYACTTLAQTNLRNLIGDRTLDETLVARDMINTNLREVLDEATNNWGVKVTRVEVQKIEPPRDITDAMSRQMKAEHEIYRAFQLQPSERVGPRQRGARLAQIRSRCIRAARRRSYGPFELIAAGAQS